MYAFSNRISGGSVRRRLLLSPIALGVLLAQIAQAHAVAGRSDQPRPPSPRGRIWVINANVREHSPQDARRHSDMRNFVDRALEMARGDSPDIVLLQQVNLSATRWLRGAFERRTGHRFVAIESPPMRVRSDTPSRNGVVRDDSAILVNASTTRSVDHGTFRVSQDREAARRLPITQVVPWAEVIERPGAGPQLRATFTSLHYPTHRAFVSRPQSHTHKARWSARLSGLVGKQMPDQGIGDGRVPVLAGDFNARRCQLPTEDSARNCRPTRFWKTLTRLNYREAMYEAEFWRKDSGVIDFVFARGNFSDVRWDYTYKGQAGKGFYSDHRVEAVLLEDTDTTPPYMPNRPRYRPSPDYQPFICDWGGWPTGWDGGSGRKEWVVFRRKHGEDEWKVIGRVGSARFQDNEVDIHGGEVYYYRIAALDWAGNMSKPTAAIRVPRTSPEG